MPMNPATLLTPLKGAGYQLAVPPRSGTWRIDQGFSVVELRVRELHRTSLLLVPISQGDVTLTEKGATRAIKLRLGSAPRVCCVEHAVSPAGCKQWAGQFRRAVTGRQRHPSCLTRAFWQGRAADPALFYASEGQTHQARSQRLIDATAVCSGCPVVRECVAFAASHAERCAVWGGLSEEERQAALARPLARART
jgi:WhiB family redox-sensing transcriptional regulator